MQNLSSLSISCYQNFVSGSRAIKLNLAIYSVLTMRPYTRGAEKLFHRVDWDRAVGLVVVVDPFDPGSLLYLPQAGYVDLIKTALANRSPLVVVHGLNDEIPQVTEVPDNGTSPPVTYRVFTVSGKQVHRVPLSQNSPLPPFRTPVTTLGIDPSEISFEIPSHSGRVSGDQSSNVDKGSDDDKGSGVPSQGDSKFLGDAYDSEQLKVIKHLYGPKGDHGHAPRLDPNDPSVKEVFPDRTSDDSEPPQGGLGLDYSRVLENLRSQLGIAVHHTLRAVSASLSRMVNPRPRLWYSFLPKKLEFSLSSPTIWPLEVGSPHRRPFREDGKVEARLLHLYAWAGATLLARSARSLQWTYCILGEFISLWHNNGLKTASAVFKEASRVLMKFLSGEQVKTSEVSGLRLSLDKGLPKILPRGLRRYIRDGHVIAIRLAFFALSVADLLKYTAKPKIETITQPYDGSESLPSMDEEIRQAVEDLVSMVSRRPKAPTWNGFHATIKAGPFGKAMLSAPLDAVALTSSPLWNTFLEMSKYIRNSGPLVQNTKYLSWLTLNFCRPFWSGFLGSLPLGKLSKVIEARGKVRVVAIPGYQVQSLLKPLHDSLFEFLELLETDHTHNQEGGVIRCMDSRQSVMNSYDLSAATDRFPRWFEAATLSHLYMGVLPNASLMATAWEKLLEGLVFSFRATRKGRLEEVTYGSGQPMGTYSSWASFAVSHHVCVLISARRAGFENFRDYDLLGDDIVLRGDTDMHQRVFDHYLVLMRSLGVGIHPKKGISSRNGSFEFAKRFVRGQDVLSSLKWKELAATTSWKSVNSLLLGMTRRGLPLPQIRVALEVGYQLIFKVPYTRDLTDVRRVPLITQRALLVPLVLFLSPIGPYKVPLVGWLSGRGSNLVDFHPNLGHFVNNVGNVIMGFDIHFPIAHGLSQVRRALLDRVLEGQGVALPTLRTLYKTMLMVPVRGSETLGTLKSLWKYPDAKSITDSLRVINLSNFSSLAELTIAIGATYRINKDKLGQSALNFKLSFPNVVSYYDGPREPGLYLGLLRTIVVNTPGHLVNLDILRDLLGTKTLKSNPDADPDLPWYFGTSDIRSGDHLGVAHLEDRIASEVAAVMPDKYRHPSQLMQDVKESITEFMKISVSDILPSALPAHMDLLETLSTIQGAAVLKAWKALRADPICTTDNIYSFPERTDVSRAPEYLLEYTNAIRLCATNPDQVPKPGVVKRVSRQLTDEGFTPFVYQPRMGYEAAFVRKSDLSRDTIIRMYRMKLQESGLHLKSLLTESGIRES